MHKLICFIPGLLFRRVALSKMLQKDLKGGSSSSSSSDVSFTLVSEPDEADEDSECQDVGSAAVNLASIVRADRDMVDASVEVFAINDDDDEEEEEEPIGTLTVSVIAKKALKVLLK